MSPNPRRRRARRTAALAAGLAVALPALAFAAPDISRSDGVVLNPALQSPDFTLDGSPGSTLSWTVVGSSLAGSGSAPLDVDVDGLGEGSHTLVADEVEDEAGPTTRTFTVDATAPGIALTSPADGAAYQVGQEVLAAYSCPGGATSCAGTVPSGSPINTATLGPKSFTVTAQDGAGNTATTTVGYQVVDTVGPTISIAHPADGATYEIGSAQIANYGCGDPGSGVALCSGSVPDGAAIDTDTLGPKTFSVMAKDGEGNTASASVTYQVVDTVNPGVAIAHPADNAKYQINTFQAADFSCSDGGSGILSCTGTVPDGNPINTSTLGEKSFGVAAVDNAGRVTTKSVQYTVVDTVKPTPPGLVSPPDGTVTNQLRPRLNWSPSTDPGQDEGAASGSGIDGYEVLLDGKVVAVLDATKTSFTPEDNLKIGFHTWRVRALDKAGNQALSDPYEFEVDPDATPAPSITGGPAAFTNDATPTFSWTGQASGVSGYRWAVKESTATVVDGEVGPGTTSVTPGPLPDGAYVFTVTQRTNGDHGVAATRAFTVDTVAPGKLTIAVRPPAASADPSPSFAWTGGEPGAAFWWQLTGPGGVVVKGPAQTVVNGVSFTVAPGAYVFQVRQADAAGNSSPWTVPEPFTVVGDGTLKPPDPPVVIPDEPVAPAPIISKPKTTKQVLPTPVTRNAKAMLPRAGARIRTVRPVLRWKARKGATLYNVQIFRLRGAKLTKVASAFPRSARYRVPKGKLKPGFRYVWRVWPYTGKRFSARPLGVSYFDVRKAAKALSRSRLLAPTRSAVAVGQALVVRWRPASPSRFYRVRLLLGERVVFSRVTKDRRQVVPAGALRLAGSYRLVVLRGVGSSRTRFATAPWARTTLRVSD